MAKRLTPEERQRREEEKARKKREREQAREARRRAKEEEKARKKREKEEKKRQKEIERGQKMKRKPRWLYWLAREQAAKKREHEQHLNAGRVALALGRAIRKLQKKIMDFVGPLIDHAAGLKTPEARMIWSQEPWSPQDRTRYNWGKRQELAELWKEFPDGVAEQDPKEAAADARRKTRARKIDHAKAIDKALDMVAAELREDEQNAVRSSLERSYEKVYADVLKELDDGRRAIDADKAGESRMADAKDYTKKGDPRRTSSETQIPQNMPRLGNYGESVKFGMPSPDQVKAVLNAEFEGKNYSERIWKDTDKLATELKEMMRAAIINGENSQVVARRLAQRMGVEYSHALRLVRTEQSRILNEAALASAKDAGADRYQFVAIEDGRTCHQCLRKNRRIYKMSEKKTGLNFPPLHPHCRCTIVARFAWEDDGDDEPTPTPTPTKPEKEPGYFERSPIQMSDSELKAVNNWITNVETVSKPAADAVRENPTKANAQAAAEAQDAAMKAEEMAQKAAIGRQKRAIEATIPETGELMRERRRRGQEEAALKKELHAQAEAKKAEYEKAEEKERARLEEKRKAGQEENRLKEQEAWAQILKEEDELKDGLEKSNRELKAKCEASLDQMRQEWARQRQEQKDRNDKMEKLIETHPNKAAFTTKIDDEQNALEATWRREDAQERQREQDAQDRARNEADRREQEERLKKQEEDDRENRRKERDAQKDAQEAEERRKRRRERDENQGKKARPRMRLRKSADSRERIEAEARDEQKRLATEHENRIKDMNEDAEAEIQKDRRESQRRIRKMKTEAEWDKKEARQKAQEEREAILAATSKEIATAQKEIERAVKKREATRDAIGETGGEIAERWAQYRTRRNDLYLTPSEYRHQAEAYKRLLLKIIDNESYGAKRQAIREYAEELGIGDRAGAILDVLTEKILNRTIPPHYFVDGRSGRNVGAYQREGGIRLRKDSRDWSGSTETVYHETGHYLDQTILKRRYSGRQVTEDPYGIQAAFEEDKRRLNRRSGQVIFKIGDIEFNKEEFRAQNNGRGYSRLRYETYLKLERAIADKLEVDISELKEKKYRGQVEDAIQSVLGWNWGDGHDGRYVTERLGTYIEAIAQITSAIAGHDFLSDILPNAYRKIKEIYEED